MKLKFVILPLLIAQGVQAQEAAPSSTSNYSFGGACASQGVWTQAALGVTQKLRSITTQLRNDANCKALGTRVTEAIDNLDNSLKAASDTPGRVNRLSQLPREIDALRGFLNSAPNMKQQVLRAMMDRSIESATLSASVATDAGPMASTMMDFGERLQRSTKMGFSMLNQVVDSIPQLNECLTGGGQSAMGNYLSATVRIASSFASSGQDLTGSQLATTISKLTNLVREKKYANVLRTLNQQEFMASMSCLMEVTSESYCQARDGMRLFKNGMEDLKITKKDKAGKISANNPFVGYYILNTHVPNITKWLQKIQIGVDPKLPTDAIFQNKIQQEVTDFYKGVKTLLGQYNSGVATINNLPDINAKRNAAVKLLGTITEAMLSGGATGFGGDDNKTNFFTISTNPLRIPFDLVGIEVPDSVSGKTYPMLSYQNWFQANMDHPKLKDPVALVDTIGHNMQEIIHSANISAIEYFNKWYIVDKAALVNEANIDINYTVEDSLKAINKYLDGVKERLVKYNGNTALIPTIIDTQIRINQVLDGFAGLQALGRQAAQDKAALNMTTEQIQITSDKYEKMINKVFDQFNVMQSRSGFLANRMVNFVYADYVLLINNRVDFTPYQQDLYRSAGMAAMDKLLQVYNGNPANIQTDLNMALKINKGNLQALEGLIKDNMVRTLADLEAQKRGRTDGVTWSSFKRLMADQFKESLQGSGWTNMFTRNQYLANLFVAYPRAAWYWFTHSDRYPVNTKDTPVAPGSEFDDVSAVMAQLCIQSLAFYDQVPFTGLCRGAVLNSPLAKELSVSYNERLSSHMKDKETEPMKDSLNYSDRICAFRDFNIRNMAQYMTITKER